MTRSSVRAFARAARWFALAAVGLGLGASALLAQGSTGKIEGHVRDQSGAPVASAQVVIVGTAFIATADARGYYFFNNVPAGVYNLKAAFVGYKPVEVAGLRVIQGQTMTQDIVLEQTPLQIEEVTVTAATNPLVPRDQVTTKQIVSGDFVKQLPVNQLNQILSLQPGILPSTTPGASSGLQVRGGRGDETATYIDGVPVSPGYRGTSSRSRGGGGTLFTELQVGVNGFEDASVTTGAYGAEFGNAQSGILNISTRSGGQKFSGDVRMESDGMWSKNTSTGYNQVELGIGGPITKNLTFNVSGVIVGHAATSGGFDSQKYPVFVAAGVDSVMKVPTVVGNPAADTNVVIFPNFAAYRGDCGQFSGSKNSGIASNYGIGCQGTRNPNSENSNWQTNAKVSYSYGSGSRVSVTGIASQNQFVGVNALGATNPAGTVNPLSYLSSTGNTLQNRTAIFSLFQNLSKRPDRALSVNANFSIQKDQRTSGSITSSSEQSNREPFGGFMFTSYDYLWGFKNIDINDALVNNFISNQEKDSLGNMITTGLNEGTPYSAGVPYRIDAYGRNASLAGISTSAFGTATNNEIRMIKENRTLGNATLDWQIDQYNRVKVGGEYTHYDLSQYTRQPEGGDVCFCDAYKGSPYRAAVYGEETLDLGDVVLKAGVRWDQYDSKANRPYFAYDSVTGNGGYAYPSTFTYPGFDKNNPTKFFKADESHSYVSPHVQVSFPVTQNTNFRLSYAHQVQAPDWGLVFAGINTDLSLTNSNNTYGADLGFAKTIIFEFGVRQSFGPDMVLDVSLYNKDKQSDVSVRTLALTGPDGQTNQLRVASNLDFGNVRGMDVRLDRRFGAWFNGTLGYTFQQAKGTGSDPFSYTSFFFFLTNTLSSDGLPPQAVITTNDSRPHQLSGSMAVTVPADWKRGSTVGAIFRNVGAFFTFRFASGLPWTTCPNDVSNKDIVTQGACAKGLGSTSVNANRLPMFKNVDLRLTKGFNLGHTLDLTAYADFRNLFNWQTITSVFAATGDIQNPLQFSENFKNDSTEFYNEVAYNNGKLGGSILMADGSVNLVANGPSTCNDWSQTNGQGGLPNCFGIYRAEERFGDGNHELTPAEYKQIFTTYYNIGAGPGNFEVAPRTIILGVQLTF
jgi:hypothetical protein